MALGDFQYHIHLNPGDIGRYVILPGDPGRVKKIAEFFDESEKVAENREYVTYKGTYKGVPVACTSTGIGGPSAAIAIEELRRVGVDTMIRVGTSGALQEHIRIGDLVIATAAIRDEGTSQQYIPLAYPAVANFHVIQALHEAAKRRNCNQHLGIIHCKDAFYGEEYGTLPLAKHWQEKWEAWEKGNALCTEMEGATLYTLGSIYNLRVGEVLAVVGETQGGEVTIKKIPMDDVILTALDAIVELDKAEA